MPAAGTYRDRVLFQQRSLDGYGQPAGPWPEGGGASFRVDLLPLRATETVMAQRLQGKQPVIIKARRCRLTVSIDNTWRAVNARTDEIYDIVSTSPADDLGEIDILAVSGGTDG
jgi:hypothetical protein